MKRVSAITIFIIIVSLLNNCSIGAGTHGKIKEYHFNNSNEEIVSIVDDFLISNQEYHADASGDFGWIYIETPITKDRFGFSIGGDSSIVLIAAGKKGEKAKWNSDLGYFEKKIFIESFENNFIKKLSNEKPNRLKILKSPFILSSNQNIETNVWPIYVFKYDTSVFFSLPKEFDSLSIDYFEDMVSSFSKFSKADNRVVQFHNIFRINEDCSGYLYNGIHISSYYRRIGQKKKFSIIFNRQDWIDFTSPKKIKARKESYKKIRLEKLRNGFSETDVYSESSEELWMINEIKLLKRNVAN
jgi:hypothetical protein